MAACPRCGYGNPDVADFCGNPDCRADLRPAPAPGPSRDDPPAFTRAGAQSSGAQSSGTHAGAPSPGARSAYQAPAPPPPPPPPASAPPPQTGPPPDEQKKGVRVEVDPLELRVEPGGPPASTTVTVVNKGSLVDDFHVTVNGPVARFAQVHPPVLHVFPGEHQTAQVRFAVPRAPHPAAGRYAFQVVARAHVHADVSGQVVGGLTVGRFDEMVASIEPEMTRGRAPGKHRFTVANKGNGPLDVRVAMADQQGELTFTPSRFGGMLAPGATATEPLVVAAPLKWFGRTQVHPFSGNVSTDVRGQAAMVQARRRQVPRFPWWVPTAVLAILALAIPIYALIPKATVPSVAGLDRAAATGVLQQAGLRVVEIEAADATIPPGQAIKTDPAANSPYKPNQVAQLFVSRGKCEGECPTKVPVVDGLLVDEAKSALVAAGFVVDRVNQVPDPRPPGTVVTTNPPGGQEVAAHEKVIINAAIGPATAAPSAPPAASANAPAPASTAAGPPPIPATLLGKPGPEVVKALTAAGLKVTQVRTHSNARALDEVLSITPPPGAPVAPGSPVTVELAAPTAVDLIKAAPTRCGPTSRGRSSSGRSRRPGRPR